VDLPLAEELLLLAGRTGGQPLAWSLPYGVAGALLAELELAGRIGYSQDARVTVIDPAPTGDGELDAVLAEIAGARQHYMEYWVEEIASAERTARIAERLADRSSLCGRRAQLRSRVTGVLQGWSIGDDRAQILGALVNACGLAQQAFPDLGRRLLKRRMAEISRGQRVAAGVRDAIRWARFRGWIAGIVELPPAGGG